jgi:hypothetical protein
LISPYGIGRELPHMLLRNDLVPSAKLKEEPYVRATPQVLNCVEGS